MPSRFAILASGGDNRSDFHLALTRMFLRSFAFSLLLIGAAGAQSSGSSSIPSADADLAWLNRYLAANSSARSSGGSQRGPSATFADLAANVGAPVRLTLGNGSKRFGVLTEASGREAALRIRVGAGHYLFRFTPADVSRIEVL